jgi:hypothetical protein
MRRTLSSALPALLVVLLLAACSAGQAGAEGSRPARDMNRISRAEIEAVGASDAYHLVQRLRPNWLRARATRSFNLETVILVYADMNRLGGVESLRSIPPGSIDSIEYLDPSRATAELPGIRSEQVAGAIVLRMRSGT